MLRKSHPRLDVGVEALLISLSGPDPNEVKRARDLCLDLLDNVKQQYERFKERGPSHDRGYSGGGGGGYQNGGHRGSYGDRQQHDSYNGGYSGGYGGAQSPYAASAMSPAAQTPGTPASATPGTDYAAQYAQYYGGQDPYAAYGGYQNYMNMYYQYYQQQQPGGVQSPPRVLALHLLRRVKPRHLRRRAVLHLRRRLVGRLLADTMRYVVISGGI